MILIVGSILAKTLEITSSLFSNIVSWIFNIQFQVGYSRSMVKVVVKATLRILEVLGFLYKHPTHFHHHHLLKHFEYWKMSAEILHVHTLHETNQITKNKENYSTGTGPSALQACIDHAA